MILDVSYRSRDTPGPACDQRRTPGCTSDKKRATGGYLVPQPSPTCLARTVQPASARPEPSLGLAAAARVRTPCEMVPAGSASNGAGRRSRALRQAAAFTRNARPCCPTRWGASAAASTRVCSHLRGRLVHYREERQTGVQGRAAAFELLRPRTSRSRRKSVLVGGDGRGPRSGSCPGFPGQLPSEEPLTGPTALIEAVCVKVRVAKARGFRDLRDVQKAFQRQLTPSQQRRS